MVTVVIPAYNAARTVAETINSLADQAVSEILVIDDGSNDDTGSTIAALAHTDPRIRLLRNEQARGPAAARNQGLFAAEGEYVIFLDSDDVLMPNAVANMVSTMTARSAAVLGRFEAIDGEGRPLDIGTWATVQLQPVVRRRGQFVPSEKLDGEALLTRLVVPPPGGILVRRSAALAVGGYDERLGRSEDIAFLVALARHGELTLLHDVVVRYRRNPQQRSQATAARRRGRQRALLAIIWSAPTRSERRALARGAAAHHLDRAAVRWRAGRKSPRDVAVTLRSCLLALFFYVAGALSILR